MMGKWGGALLAAALAVATCWGAGCGSTSKSSGAGPKKTGPSSDSGAADTGSTGMLVDNDASATSLTIQPANPTLTVSGTPATLQFNALYGGSTTPTQAQWSVVETSTVGSIDAAGLFTATGLYGGIVDVTATVGQLHASTQLTVKVQITDNPGMVPTATMTSLLAGGGVDGGADAGSVDPGFAWLYPYNGTVFPRGLLAPTLQFGGMPPDATYVHISFGTYDYKGFYGASSPGQVALPQTIWDPMTETASGTDIVTVQITKTSGGQVSGPITESWSIAQGSLRGTVYYNSYDSPLANGGAVLRLKPGASAPDVLMGGSSGCVVCHSVSADGSTIVASHQHSYDATGDLTNNNNQLAQINVTEGNHVLGFAGMYPDGTKAVTCDNCVDVSWTNGEISPSELIDPKTGQTIPSTGLVPYAATPSFSADGKFLAFNVYAGQGQQWGNSSTSSTPGTQLGILSFDTTTNTFANPQMITPTLPLYPSWMTWLNSSTPTLYPSWPVFTPDGVWAVFMYGTNTYTRSASAMTPPYGPTANLAILHVASGTTAMLDQINGYTSGTPYLPFGSAEENLNYEPTILPVAVGGYFWVVFTSRREYGNTINDADPWEGLFEGNVPAKRKKLWVAALDIGNPESPVTSAMDISHPAFYLTGQELAGGNSRGFWALDPCQQNGTSCQGGDQCCSGYCRQASSTDAGATQSDAAMSSVDAEMSSADAGDGGIGFVCVVPQACANEYEKCTTTSDCCQASQGYQCIAGFCAQPAQ